MYAICIKSNRSLIGYFLYSGFKTPTEHETDNQEPMLSLNEQGFPLFFEFSNNYQRAITATLYPSCRFASTELDRIRKIMVRNNIPEKEMWVQSLSEIEKDLLKAH